MADPVRSWRWRVLHGLLPRWYAERYAAEVLRAHAESGRRWFWWRLTIDVVLTSIQLRLSDGREPMRALIGLAARGLARTPGFTVTVVLTLGLGIGTTLT